MASTISGSNWLPAFARSSAKASPEPRAPRYERVEVIESKASATAMMRANGGILIPRRPLG